ncbi:sensor histidine kinase [Nocardia altamirensis]|uniref:sensor histidine kinase n=1 Tax=Nocardia altamirensis TaxID=472158 RepID=UPI00084080B9|nr:ATP-binding protein [Nocardia altamirensis]
MIGTQPAVTDAPRGAEAKLVRGASLFVGSGGLFYAALTAPTAFAQAHFTAAWWTPVAFLATYLPPVLIIVAAARWRMDLVRKAVAAFAFGYAFAALSWPLVRTGELLEPEASLWLVWIPGLPAVALCLFWRRVPFAYLACAGIVAQVDGMLARGPDVHNPLLPEILFAFAYSAFPCAACVVFVRLGRMLDQTSSSALATATSAAAAEARRFERRRFDALTHDGVIATLLEASRAPNSPILAHYAQTTLRNLGRLRSGLPAQDDLDLELVVAGIRAAAAEIDDSIPLRVEPAAGAELTVPPDVATALAAATGEALRNWKKHASPVRDAACEVTVTAGPADIRIDVVDDGIGFDPKAVPPDRLGLRASIVDRIAQLPGGWSAIESTPGRGSRVSVGWAA